MMTETTTEPNKFVTYFNAVIENYVEVLLTPDSPELHEERQRLRAQTAHSLDVLMQEYAKAAALLEQVRGERFEGIEIAKNAGRDYETIANRDAEAYPMLAQDISEFLEDLDSLGKQP